MAMAVPRRWGREFLARGSLSPNGACGRGIKLNAFRKIRTTVIVHHNRQTLTTLQKLSKNAQAPRPTVSGGGQSAQAASKAIAVVR
jgi:hypothetical protein